jgi:hypothetical protein
MPDNVRVILDAILEKIAELYEKLEYTLSRETRYKIKEDIFLLKIDRNLLIKQYT